MTVPPAPPPPQALMATEATPAGISQGPEFRFSIVVVVLLNKLDDPIVSDAPELTVTEVLLLASMSPITCVPVIVALAFNPTFVSAPLGTELGFQLLAVPHSPFVLNVWATEPKVIIKKLTISKFILIRVIAESIIVLGGIDFL
ncbi:hypothetical protein [Cesiribacter andamanensis]|uniref:hypothetical protein n=1 Tax=Cesiribacter andamanensis TaxID=649507 RepID=UPI0013764FD8|nr:hypothetical protein [Cesiribacter andamanensis]